jgi:class 3 adenylate cyclase
MVTAKQPQRRVPTTAAILATLECLAADTAWTDAVPGAPAERRQVTVVSCLIRVSGSQGQPLDVEEVDEQLRVVHGLCADRAAASGAVVASTFGIRAVLVFGLPAAREEDARRAVAVALDLAAAVSQHCAELEASRGLRIEVSIGVHSGLVVMRDRDSLARAPALLGSTPGMAMRLDELAAPGEILVSTDTARLLRGSVETEQVAVLPLQEEGRSLAVLRLRVPATALHREISPAAATADTPLVGRSRILD